MDIYVHSYRIESDGDKISGVPKTRNALTVFSVRCAAKTVAGFARRMPMDELFPTLAPVLPMVDI